MTPFAVARSSSFRREPVRLSDRSLEGCPMETSNHSLFPGRMLGLIMTET